MYRPRAFQEDDLDRLHDLIEAYSFGVLAAPTDGGIDAAHLPFLLDRTRGERGTLRAHVARANPIWRAFDAQSEVLAIFQGPHAYISPDWYDTADMVPTWNYTVVHAAGIPRLVEGEALEQLLADLSAIHETGLTPKLPWTPQRVSPAGRAALMKGIVGFEIAIDRLEGKFKLTQNRSVADVTGAVAGLRGQVDPLAHATADLMTDALDRKKGSTDPI
jgi:transcriptional regulator